MNMWDDDTWLDERASWERLAGERLGRLAFHLVDEVHIVPINYCAQEPRLVFRTAEGSKLLGVAMNSDVAFEIDGIEDDGGRAWSVVARGRARILRGDEVREADALGLRSWLGAADKHQFVAIDVDSVTGREYDLVEPQKQESV
ncbi:pyridoxamine 5'-phosphate oxidase family protein [Ornithinimicrobium cryptoxanthini]|uniref:pyridoxamine 5'-phosphate oxidase family protein n=1 Tax=Ornithinimicrobium cryptoxanthini TaxID=2934161 RepID=UPI00211959F7|nr:pyridoxamine 5'-phosphate oxidase family protein [Ornithinimicrobium cryptoxanthini]